MNRKQGLLIAAYFTFVLGFCFIKYLDYQSSFEYIQHYTHTSVLLPTDPIEMEDATEASKLVETQATVYAVPPSPAGSIPVETVMQTVTFPLELNTATVEELAEIPGIGRTIAEAIAAYRTAYGGFLNRAQLLEIDGIGEIRYHTLLEFVYLAEEFPLSEPEPESEPETEPLIIPVINLNTATKEQLMCLPGCTEELADSILYLRDELIHIIHNPLEITMAEGVTDALYVSWEPYLAVDDVGSKQIPLHDWTEAIE